MTLELAPPNWDALIGGTVETAWTADRHRKIELANSLSSHIERVFNKLHDRRDLFAATQSSLLCDPYAALWYVSLAGFSQKTLRNTRCMPGKFGMTISPFSFVVQFSQQIIGSSFCLYLSRKVRENIDPFCRWINYEIDGACPPEQRSPFRACNRVSLILGGKIIGQGQNDGGDEGVFLVKEFIFNEMGRRWVAEFYEGVSGKWQFFTDAAQLVDADRIRLDERLVFDFTSGGNRPDITITFSDRVVAVGEIKARKDLSNMWESWMPQVVNHMNTWTYEFPNSARLFFGTVITPQMIDGVSMKGTRHFGLRDLYKSGQLTSAYNLSQIVENVRDDGNGLNNLISRLSNLLR